MNKNMKYITTKFFPLFPAYTEIRVVEDFLMEDCLVKINKTTIDISKSIVDNLVREGYLQSE